MTLYGVDLWAGILIFARVGAIVMLLPGFGEPAVPAPVRLAFALALTVLLAPLLDAQIAPAPEDLAPAMGRLLYELAIGLSIGGLSRMLMSALASAGQIAGLETGLAFAQTTDPTMSQSGQIFAVFFTLAGVALAFAADLHHLFLQGIVGTYTRFAPPAQAAAPPMAAMAEEAVRLAGQSFLVAVQIAAPLLVAGLVYRAGLAVLARIIPQIQVFFITLPLNLLGGFLVLALSLSAGLLVWLEHAGRFAQSLQ